MPDLPNGPIQIIPRGLLGLLNLKNAGKAPPLLGGVVTPTLDLLEMYCSNLYEQVSATVAVAAAVGPVQSDLVVPETEVWFVRVATATTDVLGAGDSITLQVTIAYSGITTIPVGDPQSAAVGGRIRCTSGNDIIIAPPGSIFGCWVAALGGAVNVDIAALVTRARV